MRCYEFEAWTCWHGHQNLTRKSTGLLLAQDVDDAYQIALHTVDTDDANFGAAIKESSRTLDPKKDVFYDKKTTWYQRFHIQFDKYME